MKAVLLTVAVLVCLSSNVECEAIEGNLKIHMTRGTTHGSKPFGIFWKGAPLPAKTKLDRDVEKLVKSLAPKEEFITPAKFGDVFEIRSPDMNFRAKIQAGFNTDTESRKLGHGYTLLVKNLSYEENGEPMELKAHDSGYQWLEPGGGEIEHRTSGGHVFTLRNKERKDVISITLQDRRPRGPHEEL